MNGGIFRLFHGWFDVGSYNKIPKTGRNVESYSKERLDAMIKQIKLQNR